MEDMTVTVEQEVANVKMQRSHVVILGAGASRACCPTGDMNGALLPVMADFASLLGLEDSLRGWGIDPKQNFEEIFSDLFEQGEHEKIAIIQNAVETYFSALRLDGKPTIYDHLVLSLRENDVIATFNWDPLLMEAYLRNKRTGLRLPKLAFLHGNVAVGYCANCHVSGIAGRQCRQCGKDFQRSPLLYPVRMKDYASDKFIANEWALLNWGLSNAFMITIFGYSGPRTDQEAIAAMKKAWGSTDDRSMEQTAFITRPWDDDASKQQAEEAVAENWQDFIHTHHYEVYDDFYNSWIANHPRRTGEAYLNQYLDAKFITDNPIPKDLEFPELWEWYEQFSAPEHGVV